MKYLKLFEEINDEYQDFEDDMDWDEDDEDDELDIKFKSNRTWYNNHIKEIEGLSGEELDKFNVDTLRDMLNNIHNRWDTIPDNMLDKFVSIINERILLLKTHFMKKN